MDTADFLAQAREPIVAAAGDALVRAHVAHYESVGEDEVQRRLEALFDRLLAGLRDHDLGPIVTYAQSIADERFNAGVDLSDVQTAFNALEEATWARVLAELEPSELAESLGLVTTVLGAGKDALARHYVSLAAHTRAPSLDLRALFAGYEGL